MFGLVSLLLLDIQNKKAQEEISCELMGKGHRLMDLRWLDSFSSILDKDLIKSCKM